MVRSYCDTKSPEAEVNLVVPTGWHDITLGQYVRFMRAVGLSEELSVLLGQPPATIAKLYEWDLMHLINMLDFIYQVPETDWDEILRNMTERPRERALDLTVGEAEGISAGADTLDQLSRFSGILLESGSAEDMPMDEVWALSVRLGLTASIVIQKFSQRDGDSEVD